MVNFGPHDGKVKQGDPARDRGQPAAGTRPEPSPRVSLGYISEDAASISTLSVRVRPSEADVENQVRRDLRDILQSKGIEGARSKSLEALAKAASLVVGAKNRPYGDELVNEILPLLNSAVERAEKNTLRGSPWQMARLLTLYNEISQEPFDLKKHFESLVSAGNNTESLSDREILIILAFGLEITQSGIDIDSDFLNEKLMPIVEPLMSRKFVPWDPDYKPEYFSLIVDICELAGNYNEGIEYLERCQVNLKSRNKALVKNGIRSLKHAQEQAGLFNTPDVAD